LNLKKLFKDQYFIGDVSILIQILKEENIEELEVDFSKFEELPKEYQKIVIVLPLTNLSNGLIHEFLTETSFDTNRIKQGEYNKNIENIGKEKILTYLKKSIKKIQEIDVYRFFTELNKNKELMDKYIEAINSVFYKNQVNKEAINKNLMKIRRKYE